MALGAKHVESPFIELGQLSTAFYFSYFIIVVPFISVLENLLIDLNLKSINKLFLFEVTLWSLFGFSLFSNSQVSWADQDDIIKLFLLLTL